MNVPRIKRDELFLSWKNRSIDFMKAYQDQDVIKMLQYCAPQCFVSFLPLGDDGRGNAHIVGKNIWNALIECFPNIDNTVHNAINDNGDIRCEVTIYGKQEKDFGELKSKGNEFEEDHIFIFKVNEAGFIENITVDWDHDSFVRQLTA